MKKSVIIFLTVMVSCYHLKAQVKIGENPSTISPGSVLELESTSKALTLPRMNTVQMQAIPSPVNGMIIFNLDSNCIYFYKTNNVWAAISMDTANAQSWPYHSNDNAVGTPGNGQGIISLTGSGLVASGNYSHAEGLNSLALGEHSNSFGFADTAAGIGSSAAGYQNKSTGDYSFTLGFKNIALHQSAISMGQENNDTGFASLAVGLRNNIGTEVSYSNVLGYNNQVKKGSSNNAVGESNIINEGRGNTGAGVANVIKTGNFNQLLGNSNQVTAGNEHIAAGGNNMIRSGVANSVFGENNTADGNYLGAIGRENSLFFQSGVALGQGNKDSGWASVTGGLNNVIRNDVNYSSSFGYNNQVNGGSSNSILGESNIIKTGSANTAVGLSNTTEGTNNIIAGEANVIRPGASNSIFGKSNVADGSYLGAIGKDNSVFLQSAVALGQGNKDSGYASIAAGLNNTIKANVLYSTVLGNANAINGGFSHSIFGESNTINAGRANVSMGYSNTIEAGNYNHLFGHGNQALDGISNIGGGESNTIKNGMANSIFGQSNIADGNSLGAIGKDNIVYYQSAVALGQGNRDSGYASLAAGLNNIIAKNIESSAVFGYNNQVTGGFSNIALGEGNNITNGRANLNAGYDNSIAGSYSSVFGKGNQVTIGEAHTIGGQENIIKSGIANSLFGKGNIADGFNLGAIGRENSLFFQSGVALGQGNKDSGYASVAGGLNNVIEKNVQYSAAFGFNNISTRNTALEFTTPGAGTFSAGVNNINSGYSSIALGSFNMPSNIFSLAANFNNMSNSYCMSAFGHFNDTIAAYPGQSFAPEEILFSIGNGGSNITRRNSLTMLRNGFTTINATEEAGANVPRAELDIKGTGAIIVPVGTTAQRPEAPVVGMIRFCTDCPGGPVLQGYNGSAWVNL